MCIYCVETRIPQNDDFFRVSLPHHQAGFLSKAFTWLTSSTLGTWVLDHLAAWRINNVWVRWVTFAPHFGQDPFNTSWQDGMLFFLMMLYWEGVIGGGGHHLVDISPSYLFLSVRVGGIMTPSSVIVGICVVTMMPSTSLASLRVWECDFLKTARKMIEHFNGNIHTQSKGTHPD